MQTKSKEEIELLHADINEKFSQLLEVNFQKPRYPKLVIYNITEEVTVENAEEITQNPELTLNAEEIKPKFVYRGKINTKNLLIEVDPQTRQKIFNTKLKIGWHICNAKDYIEVNRCFKCSRYNHRASDCRGEETCPLCTGGHTIKVCSASPSDYKCVNCFSFNKYNANAKVNEKHSSLDKTCPSLQAVIDKYKETQNTNMATAGTQYLQKASNTSLRCIEINLKHSKTATDNFNQLTKETDIDIAFIQEPIFTKIK
jgi:hypothetical protein